MSKILKKRYWAFVAYPESLPDDWRDKLQQKGIQVAISPLHEYDLDFEYDESGKTKLLDPAGKPILKPKKPHYHIILCYEGPTTLANVKSITDWFNQPAPIPLDSVRGYYRYFTHKDNPDKHQYDEKEITTLNGFSIYDYTELTNAEITKIVFDITNLIVAMKITEYSDLMELVQSLENMEYFEVARKNTIYFNTFITSRRNKSKSEIVDVVADTIMANLKKDEKKDND